MEADRNMLFGILAVQMNFVGHDALIAGMNAWVLEKATPLSTLLQRTGALTAEQAQSLDALVAEHLKLHGGDPQRCLANLPSVESNVQLLRQVPDAVETSLTHHTPSYQPVGSGTATQPPQGHSSRFRILRPHARGGLGEVFVAEDTELHREVAMKAIQLQHANDHESRGRFIREAEVTGGLEHPNIVPVYGLGTCADGRPFYAMRFIRGDSLKDAVERYHATNFATDSARNLAFRKLLKRFVDVCNAVAYAHSRGILHRDLKPDNVMLGKYGETLVVDWGLAKPLTSRPGHGTASTDESALQPTSGNDYVETQMGSAVGTPAFMSPEQAAGRLDELGPASDVYSLGATLYVVLTGRSPFSGSIADVLHDVEAGDFAAPRAARPDVPAALDALVCKAMAKRREDRYPTAAALAEDIEHFLADEPLASYREPAVNRARRWARKHPGSVAGLAATVLAGIVGLVAGLYFVNAEKNRTELARQDEAEQRQNAREKEVLALAARDQARQRYMLALDAFNQIVYEVQTKLENRSGTLELRQELLAHARRGLQQLLAEAERQGSPDQTLIWSHLGTGDVELALGNTTQAQREYQTGHDLAARFADTDRNDVDAQRGLGVSFHKLGDVSLHLGDTKAALAYYQQYLAVSQRLTATDPKNARAQRDFSVGYDKLGNVTLQMGDTKAALAYYREALAARQRLADADPANARAQRDLSISFHKLGEATHQFGDAKTAVEFYQKSLAIDRRLAETDPKNAQAQRDLSVSYVKLGDVSLELGDAKSALEFYQKDLAVTERLADANPKNVQAQRDVSVSFNKLGDAMLQSGDAKAALEFYRKCSTIDRRLADADPKNVPIQRDVSVSFNKLGDATLQLGDAKAAVEFYEQARTVRQRLADADPANGQAQNDLFVTLYNLGLAEKERHGFSKAADWFRQGRAVLLPRHKKKQLFGQFENAIAVIDREISVCDNADKAIAREDFAFEQLPDDVGPLLALRVNVLLRGKKLADAVKSAERFAAWAELQNKSRNSHRYDAACVFARCAAAPDADKDALVEKLLALLATAKTDGYFDAEKVANFQKDADFDGVRLHPKFAAFAKELAPAVIPEKK